MIDLRFDGLRVLVAEDELLLAMDLSDRLTDVGCDIVGPARSLSAALALIESGVPVDLALVDLNLGCESALPIVRRLSDAGIPVILTTGYDAAELPLDFPAARVCVKPIAINVLLRKMNAVLHPQAATN